MNQLLSHLYSAVLLSTVIWLRYSWALFRFDIQITQHHLNYSPPIYLWPNTTDICVFFYSRVILIELAKMLWILDRSSSMRGGWSEIIFLISESCETIDRIANVSNYVNHNRYSLTLVETTAFRSRICTGEQQWLAFDRNCMRLWLVDKIERSTLWRLDSIQGRFHPTEKVMNYHTKKYWGTTKIDRFD